MENESRPAPFAVLSFDSASLMKLRMVCWAEAGGVFAGGVSDAPVVDVPVVLSVVLPVAPLALVRSPVAVPFAGVPLPAAESLAEAPDESEAVDAPSVALG